MLVIDGHFEKGRYKGQYLNGAKLTVELEQGKPKIGYWKINGRRTASLDDSLSVVVNQDTRIEAVAKQ